MSIAESVEAYVARQPDLAWRRQILRAFIRGLGFHVLWKMDVTGAENIPDTGPAIIMMNHISLIDPVLVMGAVTNRFVIPMTKIENVQNPFIRPFVVWWGAYSVNRGEIDRKALVNSIELVKSGQLILIAPEGTRQHQGLAEAKEGLAYVATKAGAVVIPTGISGAQHWAEDLRHLRRSCININFGRPFKFKTNGLARVPREALTAMSHEAMYQLALAVRDTSMRGFYSDIHRATTDYLEFVQS
jgi:1-acyl-sn-glycerol-3-phosphate acyltransferase